VSSIHAVVPLDFSSMHSIQLNLRFRWLFVANVLGARFLAGRHSDWLRRLSLQGRKEPPTSGAQLSRLGKEHGTFTSFQTLEHWNICENKRHCN
jgi:hypothetical protein